MFKNVGLSFIASLSYSLTQWVIISAITYKFDLKTTGMYATVLGLATLINQFFNFGARQIAYSSESEQIKSISPSVFTLQCIGLLVFILFCFYFYSSLIVLGVGIFSLKIIESFIDYKYGLSQRKSDYFYIAKSRLARSLFGVVFFLVSLVFLDSLVLAVYSQLIASCIVLYSIDKVGFNSFKKADFKYGYENLVILGLPLAITSILISARSIFPRFILEDLGGFVLVGNLVAFLYFITAGGIVVQSLSQVFAPEISKKYNQANIKGVAEKFLSGLLLISLFCITFVLLFSVLGKSIFEILYDGKVVFTEKTLFPFLLCACLTYFAAYTGYCISAIRAFKFQPYLFSFLLIMTIGALFGLDNDFGIIEVLYILSVVNAAQLSLLIIVFIYKVWKVKV